MLRALCAALILAAATAPAVAHDFYHPGCCHELELDAQGKAVKGDCGPADLIKQLPQGTLFRQRITNIEVIVPVNFPNRYVNEHDGLYHICVSRMKDEYTGELGAPNLYCVYEPPGT